MSSIAARSTTNGRIFFNTLDDHTVAVDAKTGKEVWAVKLGEITKGMTLTMAPIAVKGKILVGNSGGEMGVRRLGDGARRTLGQDRLARFFPSAPTGTC